MITMIMVTGGNDDDNDAMVICKLSRVMVDGGDGDNDDGKWLPNTFPFVMPC